MTTPIRPEPPAYEYLMYLRETGQKAEAAEFEQYLRETGQEAAIGQATRQSEYQSGRLGRRMQRENQNEREQVEAEMAAEANTSGLRGAGIRGLGALSAVARDIPGVEAAQAGIRSLIQRQPYGEALGDIRSAQAEVNPVSRTGLRLIGGGVSAAALPGSPAMQGARYGGLLNIASADPDKTVGERALTGATGAVGGGLLGKAGDVAATGLRALRAPNFVKATRALEAQRSQATAPLYAQAEREGVQSAMTPVTPQLRNVLDESDISGIVGELQTQRQFRGLPENDPRMLDAVYKALSDIERQLQNPLNAMNPTRVNTGRFNVANVQAAKRQLLDAMSEGAGAPMPTYRGAVQEYAAQSAPIDAMSEGFQAMRTAMGAGGSPDNLLNKGPEALGDMLRGAAPEVVEAARTGALGGIKRSVGAAGLTGMLNPLRTVGRASLLDGAKTIREIERFAPKPMPRSLLEFLQSTGVSGITPDVNP